MSTARDELLDVISFNEAANHGKTPEGLVDALRAEVVVQRDAEIIAWLGKKAREYRSTGRIQHTFAGAAIDAMASKIARGAVRADNTLGADTRAEVLRRMADAAEKDTQPADFFQPGRTYRKTLTVSTWLYLCEHVTIDPNNGERISLGWHRRLEDDNPDWFPKLPLRQDEWDSGKWAEATADGDSR
jgi:hypothetical protein